MASPPVLAGQVLSLHLGELLGPARRAEGQEAVERLIDAVDGEVVRIQKLTVWSGPYHVGAGEAGSRALNSVLSWPYARPSRATGGSAARPGGGHARGHSPVRMTVTLCR